MAAVVDAPALDQQHEAFRVLRQDVDRLVGHLGERRLAGLVLRAVVLVLHVRPLEEAEQVVDVAGSIASNCSWFQTYAPLLP